MNYKIIIKDCYWDRVAFPKHVMPNSKKWADINCFARGHIDNSYNTYWSSLKMTRLIYFLSQKYAQNYHTGEFKEAKFEIQPEI